MNRRWIAGALLVVSVALCVRFCRLPILERPSAVGTLKSLSTSQEQFKQQAMVDQDRDGIGEYATFQEMCGTVPCRQSRMVADPTFMSANFGRTAAEGTLGQAVKSGFHFLIYLPDALGIPRPEAEAIRRGVVPLDALRQETHWVAYAWPVDETAGTRLFVVNQEGQVYAADNAANGYAWDRVPLGDAAFGAHGDITGPILEGEPTVTRDVWTRVGG